MNTSNQDKATARPWHLAANKHQILTLDDDGTFHDIFREELNWEIQEANAALIVRAVNEHAALLAVAEAADIINNRVARWRSSGIESGQKGRDADFSVITANLANALSNLAAIAAIREGKALPVS